MRQFDAVVIGAGAMGSSTAWHLARRGRSVLLTEQFEQGHNRGSSHGAVRIFRLAYDDVHYVRMAQAALPMWRELEADTGKVLLELNGVYDHGPHGSITSIADALAAAGFTAVGTVCVLLSFSRGGYLALAGGRPPPGRRG